MNQPYLKMYFGIILIAGFLGIIYFMASKRIRWINNIDNPSPPLIGHTIVATYWPGRYFLINTFEIDSNSPLAKLTRSMETGESFKDVKPVPNSYVTLIAKCDKFGVMTERNINQPLFEKEHPDL